MIVFQEEVVLRVIYVHEADKVKRVMLDFC